MPVFGTADEIRHAIRIEINRRGAHVVAFDVRVGKQAHVGEQRLAIGGAFLAGKQCLGTFIQRKI